MWKASRRLHLPGELALVSGPAVDFRHVAVLDERHAFRTRPFDTIGPVLDCGLPEPKIAWQASVAVIT